jgi:hypothetical protein
MDFNIPSDKTDIVLAMSPGTKAAILFYLLCKYVSENSMNITIHPVSEVTVDNEYYTIEKTNKIIEYVKNKFPSVNIDEPRYIRKVFDDPLVPRRTLKEEAIEYQKENSINAVIMTGTTKVLELDYLEKIQNFHGKPLANFDKIKYMIDNAESLRVPNLGNWPIDYVFSEFTKDQIYKMYETYSVKDLFDLTLSCDKNDLSGCGMCFGCAERSYLENNI